MIKKIFNYILSALSSAIPKQTSWTEKQIISGQGNIGQINTATDTGRKFYLDGNRLVYDFDSYAEFYRLRYSATDIEILSALERHIERDNSGRIRYRI
jgi:hypothetical protein